MNVVYVHGGVSGRAGAETASDLSLALRASAREQASLEAVESAVRVMEDDPTLNAGYGSVLNRSGDIELDAGIVDGRTGRWAGVANVDLAHPISLARIVLERTPHVLMTGAGAQVLGDDAGLQRLGRSTPDRHDQWERARRAGELETDAFARPETVDTVGAVALDDSGGLAAASSTGGVFAKLPGRVGDSPILGAGIYADEYVAVVGTGVGELFLETMACLRVAELVRNGRPVQKACVDVIELVRARGTATPATVAGEPTAGLLALDGSGAVGAAYIGASWQVEGPEGALEALRL